MGLSSSCERKRRQELTWINAPELRVRPRGLKQGMLRVIVTPQVDECSLEEHQLIVDHPDRHRVPEIEFALELVEFDRSSGEIGYILFQGLEIHFRIREQRVVLSDG